jgi:hypothetical protein
MDSTTFDGLTRNLGSTLTRRSALRGLFAGTAAVVAGGARLHVEDAAAKRRKKGKKNCKADGCPRKGKSPFLPSGALCQSDSQCDAGQKQICEVPQNASNSDHRCCGAAGAVCGGVNEDGDFIGPLCCIGEAGVRAFVCSQSNSNTPNTPGTCIPAPADD